MLGSRLNFDVVTQRAALLLIGVTFGCASSDSPGALPNGSEGPGVQGVAGTGIASGGSSSGGGDSAGTGTMEGMGGIVGLDGPSPSGSGAANSGGANGAPILPPLTDPAIDGPAGAAYEYKVHHPLRLTLDGPMSSDTGTPNPFIDFRLIVTFSAPSGKTFAVPGYFAADGNGGSAGNRWRVHFNPPEVGSYTYAVSFRALDGIAITSDPSAGTPLVPDGQSGAFDVAPTDKQSPDFRATGKLTYVGQHYLRTIGDNAIWLKTGSNSPENILGYVGFVNTTDGPNGAALNFLHEFTAHIADWNSGDPDWDGGQGKGIIGLINYYASVGVNQFNAMTLTLDGDGDDVVPFVSRGDRQRFDNAKLYQWETVFSHADARGVAVQYFLCETENCDLLGMNANGRLYYREMIARFAHHGGAMWNIGEENNFGEDVQKEIAAYLMSLDPYRGLVSNHSHVGASPSEYPPLMGDENITGTSIQDSAGNAAELAESLRNQSAEADVPWVIMYDELSPANVGVTDCPNPGDGNCDAIRETMIWPFLLSGGGGFEWYGGYQNNCGDLTCEDLRQKAMIFQYSRVARDFLAPLPLAEMGPGDDLVGGDAKVWFKTGGPYAIYLPDGGNAQLNLASDAGAFRVRFYDVRDGIFGPEATVNGGASVSLGVPPFGGDVAVLVERR